MISNDEKCKVKKGLLFLNDCGQTATEHCSKCSRPVCKNHIINTSTGLLCPECAAEDDRLARKPRVSRFRMRNMLHSSHGYLPYYYGHNRFYSDQDYQAFEEQSDVDDALADSDMNDGFDSSTDDFMES